ncbi:MAG TPA: hypothetical protein VLS87_08820 [Woeseiaceae bacterium]|nr:hypothetical protein [Woeseiaceae bacterium]
MHSRKRIGLTAIAVIAVLAAACTGPTAHTHVDHVARAKELPSAPYKRVLIVATAARASSAREFEEVLAKDLTSKHTYAFGYHRAASRADVIEEVVRSLAELQQADAIIVVTARLVNAEREVTEERTDVRAQVIGGSLVDFFRYDYKEYTSPPAADYRVNVQVQTDMFDVATEQRVYTVESRTEFAETTSEIVLSEATQLAKRLRKDGLVR